MTKNEAVALLEREQDHTRFLEELLAARHGDGWNKLAIFDAKKVRELEKSCAAGPWNYDMSKAPRDGRMLLLDDRGIVRVNVWRSIDQLQAIAWAELRLPKEKP